MNPLQWRREYQIALIIAALIGGAIGLTLGFLKSGERQFWGWLEYTIYPNYPTHFGEFGWGIVGAVIGAAVIYAVQMMRR